MEFLKASLICSLVFNFLVLWRLDKEDNLLLILVCFSLEEQLDYVILRSSICKVIGNVEGYGPI